MRAKHMAAATAVAVGLVFVVAWAFSWPIQKTMALAPIIVVAAGAAVGVLVLWARVLVDSFHRSEHPRRVVAITVGAVALIALLSVLGVTLPRE